ncbi:hypothetical protein UlMin_036493 [Ulmus minor]
MELLILSLLLFVPTLYFLYLIFNIPKATKGNGKIVHPPPGSSGWPVFGETLDYLHTLKNGFPEKFISDRQKKYSSDVFKTSLLGESMVFLCSAEGNKFLFSNENKLVKSWWPKNVDTIFAKPEKTTEEEAAKMRKTLSPLLKPNALRKYVAIMDLMSKKHIKTYWDGKDQVKVQPLTKKYALALACRVLLNIEDQSIVEKFAESIGKISSGIISFPVNLPGTNFNRAIRASKQLKEEIEKLVVKIRIDLVENKVAPTNDILSDMFKEAYSNGETMNNDSEIAYTLGGLLVGAGDTVSLSLFCIVMCLAERPQVYEGVFREQMEISKAKGDGELLNWEDIQKMRYSWCVACEVMRLFPPSPGTFREAITDFTYEGFLIPKGFKFHWNAHATHKNPKYFSDPEKFDPSRFEGKGPTPFSYVPFGGGPRMCPGNEYARVKILVFMHNVVTNFKLEKVFSGEKIIMGPALTAEKGLPIHLYPHKP